MVMDDQARCWLGACLVECGWHDVDERRREVDGDVGLYIFGSSPTYVNDT